MTASRCSFGQAELPDKVATLKPKEAPSHGTSAGKPSAVELYVWCDLYCPRDPSEKTYRSLGTVKIRVRVSPAAPTNSSGYPSQSKSGRVARPVANLPKFGSERASVPSICEASTTRLMFQFPPVCDGSWSSHSVPSR